MQQIDRPTWYWLIGSIVMAIGLVSLIPLYDLTGGHAEHGMGHTASGPTLPSAAEYRFVIATNGVRLQLTATAGADATTIADIREFMLQTDYRYLFGDFADQAGGQSPAVASTVTEQRDRIEIVYRETDAGSEIVLTSADGDVVALLHEWMRALAHDHGAEVVSEE